MDYLRDVKSYERTMYFPNSDKLFSAYIVGDSRTWVLDERVWSDFGYGRVTFLSMRGAEVDDISSDLLSSLRGRVEGEISSIKLCLGLNNVLNGQSPDSVFERLLILKQTLLREFDNIVVAFADIAPVDLSKWQDNRPFQLSNTQANCRIRAVNNLIYVENKKIYRPFLNPGSTPFLSRALVRDIKCNFRGKPRQIVTVQKSFLRDGLHVTAPCKQRWVKTLTSSLKKDLIFLKNKKN